MSCALSFNEEKSSLNIWGRLSTEHGFFSSVCFGIQAATCCRCWNEDILARMRLSSLQIFQKLTCWILMSSVLYAKELEMASGRSTYPFQVTHLPFLPSSNSLLEQSLSGIFLHFQRF